jgi:hypothetical protein
MDEVSAAMRPKPTRAAMEAVEHATAPPKRNKVTTFHKTQILKMVKTARYQKHLKSNGTCVGIYNKVVHEGGPGGYTGYCGGSNADRAVITLFTKMMQKYHRCLCGNSCDASVLRAPLRDSFGNPIWS